MTQDADQRLIDRMAGRPLTYPDVGAIAAGQVPAGYPTLRRSITLGRGDQAFGRAGRGLMSWEMHRRSGLGIVAAAPQIVPGAVGTVVVLVAGRRPLALYAPCRLVSVTTEPQRHGFAYGTLRGHPESGEESFDVRLEDDERVTFTVQAFSRPATPLARIGGPVSRWVQGRITDRYLRAMLAITAA